MKRYIHNFSTDNLDEIRLQLSDFLAMDINEIIDPYLKFKWGMDFNKSTSSILDMINVFGSKIDLILNLQIDTSIDKMLSNSLLENYYSITEFNSQLRIKQLPEGFRFMPSKRYLEHINSLNPPNQKITIKEFIPESDVDIQSYLSFIQNQGYINRNNNINTYSIMEHQIKKILQCNCFIQDIFQNILLSLSSECTLSELTFEDIIASYKLSDNLDVEKAIESLKMYDLPFIPPYLSSRRKVSVNNIGKDLQMLIVTNPEFLKLFDLKTNNRVSCTYQNMKDFNMAFTNKIVVEKQFENMCLFEMMTGVNHSIHFFSLLLPYMSDNYVLDFVDQFYNSIKKYPNICTRIFLIDEILCLLDTKSLPYVTFEICQLLDIFQPLYKEKFDLMSSFLWYYLNKVEIERGNPKYNIQYIINSLLVEYQKQNLPWILHSDGIFIHSKAQRSADQYFVTNKTGKDKPTRFYKAIQNEILLLNKINSSKG